MPTEKLFRKLSTAELSAIMLKGSPVSADRDTGFCSGSSEAGDDISIDHSRLEPHSPTDASEDSVEVKITPITIIRNKRKSSEPSRVICDQESGPIKKRIRYTSSELNCENDNKIHFRPWDHSQLTDDIIPNPAEILVRHPGVTTLHLSSSQLNDIQDEPLALVAKKVAQINQIENSTINISSNNNNDNNSNNTNINNSNGGKSNLESLQLFKNDHFSRLKMKVFENSLTEIDDRTIGPIVAASTSSCSTSSSICNSRPQQRNYKNMTRERRIEANARERTRVHTISAAYDTLRRAIPSYSHTQKLSKLSVLRIACSYILTLSRMAGYDYSEDQSEPSLANCVELITRTIQTEGKIRKKKDE